MSKFFSFIVACFLMLTSNLISGQDTLKLFHNNWGTELNFNPFDGNLSFNNANAQIKLRKFVSSKKALRLAFTINYLQDNINADSPYGTNPVDYSNRRNSLLLAVNFGTEKHLAGTRRISPYIGWELGFGFKSSKQDYKNTSLKRTIKGAWENIQTYNNGNYYYSYTTYNERGFWSVGGNLIAGFDFYMSKGFYFGFELLFGLDYLKYSNIDITQTGYSGSGEIFPDYNDESWRFGPKLVNGIRIGYIF